uniref:Uncharacterized protein n=1 Tax=Triticum urartu TaxID=4572 RepID=A0A8R7R3Y9_TRIUA
MSMKFDQEEVRLPSRSLRSWSRRWLGSRGS